MFKKIQITIFVVGIILMIIGFGGYGMQAFASRDYRFKACTNGPKISITPTPTTNTVCVVGDCNTPTPTIAIATPSATQEITAVPSTTNNGQRDGEASNSDATVAHNTCNDATPGDVPNFAVKVNEQGMELDWAIIPQADAVTIRYGLQDGIWIYGAIGMPNNGHYEVTQLQKNTAYWYQIAGMHGCAIGKWSKSVDPTYTGK